MKQKLQGLLTGILIGTVLTGGAAFAKNGSELIEAFYSNIKIFVDGAQIEPKDANGEAVEPFIYNGTTYLPVRAVGEAIGKEVTWDPETNSVYLTEPKKTETLDEENENPVKPVTPAPEQEKEDVKTNSLTSKKILQISGYTEEDISGSVTLSWTAGKTDAEFFADLKCNNGGLADYALCKIELTETISCTEKQFDGYFNLSIHDKVKYEKLLGKISITDTEIILNTQEYDYNLKAVFAEKLYYSDFKSTSSMVVDAVSLNGEKASGLLNIDFNEDKSKAAVNGSFKVGEDNYTIVLDEVISITENELCGMFTVLCNDEAVVSKVSGSFNDLHTALGQILTFEAEGFTTLELRLIETVH